MSALEKAAHLVIAKAAFLTLMYQSGAFLRYEIPFVVLAIPIAWVFYRKHGLLSLGFGLVSLVSGFLLHPTTGGLLVLLMLAILWAGHGLLAIRR
jgi:hypothetical protein